MTHRPLRVGFAGTPAFAARALAALIGAGFTIPVVLAQPDRPKGRGLATAAAEVKALAIAHALPVLQPASLRTDDTRKTLAAVDLDVLVVAAYGMILPADLLAWPRHGCLNIHASLLPRWRGAAPVARAIAAGDAETGVTIMQMDAGLDTGAMIARRTLAIGADETAGTLTARLAALGAAAIVDVLHALRRDGALASVPQPAEGASYAHKVTRADAQVDWRLSADAIARAVRAFDPWPGAWTTLDGAPLKLWRATALPDVPAAGCEAGVVLAATAHGIHVACGAGTLRIDELQPANARRMPAAAFVAGRALAAGTRLGA